MQTTPACLPAVAGLTGGPGVVPGANMGTHATIFEQGARHIGMDIAGRDVANPTAIILAASMMLRHIQLPMHANRLDSAVHKVLLVWLCGDVARSDGADAVTARC